MKKLSLHFQFLFIVLSAILCVTVFIGGFSIYEADNYIQTQTQNLIDVTCENEAAKINYTFRDMEKSVRIMENYVLSFFETEADIRNPDKQQQALQFADSMFVNIAKDTDGAVAYYLRLNPELSSSTAGIFCGKTDDSSDTFTRHDPTDIALYEKDDTEHVGWFWQPYEAGTPIWMAPYYNQNIDIYMISYVVPLYLENTFIGVVGMDFDYAVLTELIQTIKIYEHGFAALEDLDDDIPDGTASAVDSHSYNPDDYLQVSRPLVNGMTLVLSASYDDIMQIRYEMAFNILFVVLLFVPVFSLIAIVTVKKIVKPLRQLTDASIRLTKGDYEVEISSSNIHEIDLLSTAFENMIVNLREYKKLQYNLAFRDSMTGLRNTTAFKAWEVEFNKRIQEGDISFGVIVFDLNYLKEINDSCGHIYGNELITTASRIICDTFKRSPVFRIGGDEFLVILQNDDLENRETLLGTVEAVCAFTYIGNDDAKFPVSIAKGFSEFIPGQDTQFSDVFERADSEMYKNKRDMKSVHN